MGLALYFLLFDLSLYYNPLASHFLCTFFKQPTVTYLFLICYEAFLKKELLAFYFSP